MDAAHDPAAAAGALATPAGADAVGTSPGAQAAPVTRAERRGQATAETRASILAAGRARLLADGYANLTTRAVAEAAGVPLSQIHYHFGSKQQLILAVLEAENARLLERQRSMYETAEPLWRRWDLACDYLDEDLESGYVRILQEMIAAGWSDTAVAAAVRELLGAWYRLLADVARGEAERTGGLGPFTPEEVAMLMGLPFMGAEGALLLGMDETEFPSRSALRKLGSVIRGLEKG
jgi:AcrR family transcriptional regulator